MGLQVHLRQEAPHRAFADGFADAVGNRLAGQVRAGPVRDVQAPGDRLQAGQGHDLGLLGGGEITGGWPGRVLSASRPSSPWSS